MDTFSYVLWPANVTVKEVNRIRCFAIDIAKDLILLSCRLAMEHLCALQLETTLATLVTTWFTLADRRWRSRYRSSDQCILNVFRSPERYNGWCREQLGQRFIFFNFFPMMTENAWNWGWGTYVPQKGIQFLLHKWHPSCYSCCESDKSWMRKGRDCDFDKRNIFVVICVTDIP